MWDFFGMIWEQLGETFKWFLTGFFGCAALLIILYKNNLIHNSKAIGFIKKVSYYLFLPLFVGIISWFFSTTLIVEKDAKELARISIEKAEKSLFPEFYKYIISYTEEWTDGKIKTKNEWVDSYLKNNNYVEGDLSTKAMRWTLINGLEFIENTAIENGNMKVAGGSINLPLLVSNYFSNEDNATSAPFNYLKGLSYSTIHNYARSLYIFYFIMYFLVFLILLGDVIYTLKQRKAKENAKILNPSTTLKNHQKKLSNSVKELDQKNLLEE